MAYPISKFWIYPFCRLLIRNVKGMENIPRDKRFIVVANHEKLIDPFYVLYLLLRKLNKKIHFIASPRWWFLGNTICRKWAGCIPLFNSKKAYLEAKELLKQNEIIGIFPEGNLYKKVRIPKSGALRLSIETNTPILPIGIKSSYFPFSSKVNIGKLIYPKKGTRDIEEQTFKIMDYVYKLRNGSA